MFASVIHAYLRRSHSGLTDPAMRAMPIRERFRHVHPADDIHARQIRDGPGHPTYASAAAAGKSQSIHGVFKQPGSVRRKLDRITVDFRVVGRSLRPVSAAHR